MSASSSSLPPCSSIRCSAYPSNRCNRRSLPWPRRRTSSNDRQPTETWHPPALGGTVDKARARSVFRFDQIPEIAVEILENDDRAVVLVTRFFTEMHALRLHARMVALEIVGMQEEENPPSGLIADAAGLFVIDCPRQQQTGTLRATWSNPDPALGRIHGRVFQQLEIQRP